MNKIVEQRCKNMYITYKSKVQKYIYHMYLYLQGIYMLYTLHVILMYLSYNTNFSTTHPKCEHAGTIIIVAVIVW